MEEPYTPTRHSRPPTSDNSQTHTPISKVLDMVDTHSTPTRPSGVPQSPFSSPALRRLDTDALRERLKEAYGLLKEKERNLFLAATVGQELVDANQQLQDDFEQLQAELESTRAKLAGEKSANAGNPKTRSKDGLTATDNGQGNTGRLHGQRRSVAMQLVRNQQDAVEQSQSSTEDEQQQQQRERQWMKVHVRPLKAQLGLAQERTDELLAEREELASQVYTLKQDHAAMMRRATEASAASEALQRSVDILEEDKADLRKELDAQRTLWSRRFAEHQKECQTGSTYGAKAGHLAEQHALDAAARLQAEQIADDMRAKHNASQRECELLRSELAKQQDTEKTFWQPLRMQWLAGQEEVQELQESYQAVCNALAQAEARLSELDQSTISDPVKASTEKTTTSLLGELDMARHRAVSEQQELYKEHSQLKRAYVRTLGAQSRMKQQVARLSQLAASGASEARMRRLEAALGEAECQRQAMAWTSMASPQPQQQLADDSLDVPADSTVLVATLRTKLRRVAADRDQALRELRTAHLLRANEIQRTRELEREVADTENRLRRAGADIAALRTQFETLKRSTRNSKKPSHDSLPGDSPIASMRIMPPNSKPRVAEKAPPPRKRTPTKIPATGGSDISAEDAKKPGPMSLAFVINSESNGGPPKGSMSDTTLQNQMEPVNRKRSASGSPAGAQSPKVFGSRPSDYTALSLATSTVETETSVGTSSSFLDMRTLAGRGMRSCCQSLASAVKSVGLCSSKPKVTTTGPSGSASSNPSPTSPPVKRPRKKGEASVEEIFTFTHANTQKPSECTNQ